MPDTNLNRRGTLAQWGACAIAALVSSNLALAQTSPPVNGRDYLTLAQPVATDAAAGQVEVLEFFWYGCPHCNAFEPMLNAWRQRQSAQVRFKRVHVAFRDDFVAQQRLHCALDAMGLTDRLHARFFAAIHQQRKPLSSAAAITDWVAAQGVDRAEFEAHYRSFSVAACATRATQLMNAYNVQGVPALGVAGRYYVDGETAGSLDRVLSIVDHLVGRSLAH